MTWYECTRHTFASQWVMANGSLLAIDVAHGEAEVVSQAHPGAVGPGTNHDEENSVAAVRAFAR